MARKTVHSELPITNEGHEYKLTLVPLDLEDTDPLILPYNPESYSTDIAPQWQARGAAAAWSDRSDWSGNAPKSLSYSQILTTQNVAQVYSNGMSSIDTRKMLLVERICLMLEDWAERPTDLTQRPTRFDVLMGVKSFRGHISQLKITRLRTTQDGYAKTAEISITFTANPE
jgi:Holliday junction resolvase-like predicted endonuclease